MLLSGNHNGVPDVLYVHVHNKASLWRGPGAGVEWSQCILSAKWGKYTLKQEINSEDLMGGETSEQQSISQKHELEQQSV